MLIFIVHCQVEKYACNQSDKDLLDSHQLMVLLNARKLFTSEKFSSPYFAKKLLYKPQISRILCIDGSNGIQ